ncbi:MAG: phosphate acetyltransferase [Verrucomicrobiales bacterium]|nr:phosphate acetyltransferase [Verrucomicrobiales bacterium]
MKHIFFLAASSPGVGLTSVSLGVFRALDRRGIKVGFCKPISQNATSNDGIDPSIHFVRSSSAFSPPDPIPLEQAEQYLRDDRMQDLMELVVSKVNDASEDLNVLVVEGLLPTHEHTFPNRINSAIVTALSAEVIIVHAVEKDSILATEEKIKTTATLYGGIKNPAIIGCILNKVETQTRSTGFQDPSSLMLADSTPPPASSHSSYDQEELTRLCENFRKDGKLFKSGQFDLIGFIPWNRNLLSYRMSDVAQHLAADVLFEGDSAQRRVTSIALCARNVQNILHVFKAGSLLLTPVDRYDIIMATSLAALNKVPMAGLILTGGHQPPPQMIDFCRHGFETGLPILRVHTDSFTTATRLAQMSHEIPATDIERFESSMDFIARNVNGELLQDRLKVIPEFRMSPAAFRHKLARTARENRKRIILPEGEEPRTILAAVNCAQRNIATCILVGNPDEIHRIAAAQDLVIGQGIEIIDPTEVRDRYLDFLLERRKHKNLNESQAREALEDNVMLATAMLELGEVDGLVSGAVHSTANTIRPALQLIRTHPSAKVVSSVFFMCLPEQVLVYADCAVNPDPDAETLADIAIQSADSAAQFGIPARVALISYSTGESGSGVDVDKVRHATQIAQAQRPDLLIDGPLQYDAAAIASVAASKAPNSPVAGKATVFIFPDLNTGNTTYKAVQRSANVISIGPMLQGLRKPVNDLSRGALVDDIIYTIALTAIQAQSLET